MLVHSVNFKVTLLNNALIQSAPQQRHVENSNFRLELTLDYVKAWAGPESGNLIRLPNLVTYCGRTIVRDILQT